MKKTLVVVALIFTIAIGTFAVHADTGNMQNVFPNKNGNMSFKNGEGRFNKANRFTEEERDNLTQEERQEWFEERTEYKRQAIEEALVSGNISEEQAKDLEEELQMKKEFHKENGFKDGVCNGERFGMKLNEAIGRGNGRRMRKNCRFQ